jgi:hypothetical protein
VPEAVVTLSTRKKINQVSKALENRGPVQGFGLKS